MDDSASVRSHFKVEKSYIGGPMAATDRLLVGTAPNAVRLAVTRRPTAMHCLHPESASVCIGARSIYTIIDFDEHRQN